MGDEAGVTAPCAKFSGKGPDLADGVVPHTSRAHLQIQDEPCVVAPNGLRAEEGATHAAATATSVYGAAFTPTQDGLVELLKTGLHEVFRTPVKQPVNQPANQPTSQPVAAVGRDIVFWSHS